MRKKPICIEKKIIAQSRLFTIEQLHLQFANGVQRIYERIPSSSHGAVLIVALTQQHSVLLVREYSAGTDAYELAFPKGRLEPGETAIEAANRELREEVGFAARKLLSLKSLTLAPGFFGARLQIVVAWDLYPSPLEGDEPEPLEVIEWPLEASDDLLASDDFSEARSVAALLLVKRWLKKENNNEK